MDTSGFPGVSRNPRISRDKNYKPILTLNFRHNESHIAGNDLLLLACCIVHYLHVLLYVHKYLWFQQEMKHFLFCFSAKQIKFNLFSRKPMRFKS